MRTPGSLPPGLGLTGTPGSTAALTGTPTASGAFNFSVDARDADECTASTSVRVNVSPAGSCVSDATRTCFQGGRFGLGVNFVNPNTGEPGTGQPVSLTVDTSYFWSFSPNNIELLTKVVDGRSFNGHYWLFAGALTNVPYTLSLTDTMSQQTVYYSSPSVQQTLADTAVPFGKTAVEIESITSGRQVASVRPIFSARSPEAVRACAGSSTALCLNASRFQVSVAWRVPPQGTSGAGNATSITGDTGDFWFFSANNIELVVKVVDGRAFNNKFWVFFGALSNVEYTITVTDTQTGQVRTYFNAFGNLTSSSDTAAF